MPQTIQRYVALGDSLSAGVSDWGQGDLAHGFTALLADLLRQSAPTLHFTNLGVGGARTADVLHGQVGPALALQPDLVTLIVGANDLPGTPTPAFQREYSDLVGRLRMGVSGLVLVANIPEMAQLLPEQYATYRFALRERVRQFNQMIADITSAHGVALVDLYSSQAAHDPRNLSSDGVHPNRRGYRELARAFVTTLNRAGYDLPLPEVDV